MDWQGARDMLGTSSIDDLIDYAVERGQIAEVRRDTERRAALDSGVSRRPMSIAPRPG